MAADWLLKLPCSFSGPTIELMRRIGISNLTSKSFHHITQALHLQPLNLIATASSSMGATSFDQRPSSLSSLPTELPVMRSIADGVGKYLRLFRSGVGWKTVVMRVLRMCRLCRPSR